MRPSPTGSPSSPSLPPRWARLRRTEPNDRRVPIILANYPNRDGRIANGVGLDTPAGTVEALRAMKAARYETGDLPADGDALVSALKAGPTNALKPDRTGGVLLPMDDYLSFFSRASIRPSRTR